MKKTKKKKAPSLIDLSMQPENMKAAGPTRPLCQKCGLHQNVQGAFVLPWIPKGWTRKLLVVGPSPMESDDYVRPLKAKVGRYFRRLLRNCNLDDADSAFVSAVRCPSETVTVDQIRCCRPFLLYAIDKLKPRGILGLGKFALKALSNTNHQNITKARGKNIEVFNGKQRKII